LYTAFVIGSDVVHCICYRFRCCRYETHCVSLYFTVFLILIYL